MSSLPDFQIPEDVQNWIDTKLSSKLWRMNNLYTIKDKHNTISIMKLNASQYKVLLDFKHNKKIILKSRQQGISTLFLAYYLDDCLFDDGYEAGIQSYGKDEAKKLSIRARLMWENLDPAVKDILGITLDKDNDSGMYFSNKSILKIGNFRGDTLQGLHVSELGKIAKKYPDKAEELNTGAFEAVAVNNKITVESTAEGKSGLFYEMWQTSSRLVKLGRKLSALDFQPIFLPWFDDPDCQLFDEQPIDKDTAEYFSKLEKQLDIVIQPEYKWWYIAKERRLKHKMKQEYPSTPEEAFEQSLEGSILRKEYQAILEEKRVVKGLTEKRRDTYVSYDIGVNDKCVLHFAQKIHGKWVLVYTYAATGEGIPHYVEVMEKTGYSIVEVFLPHDANVTEFGTGMTRLETFEEAGVPCTLIEKQSHKDYINALRNFIPSLWFDEEHSDEVLNAIQEYMWKFDKRLQVFLQTPEHNDASNYVDSLKYMALGLGFSIEDFDENDGYSDDFSDSFDNQNSFDI